MSCTFIRVGLGSLYICIMLVLSTSFVIFCGNKFNSIQNNLITCPRRLGITTKQYTVKSCNDWHRLIFDCNANASRRQGAKTINVFRACLGAQLTICAQK